jgi:hypothetical protein
MAPGSRAGIGIQPFIEANRKKTECKLGHKYDETNTYLFKNKKGLVSRHCRICRKIAEKKNRRKCAENHSYDFEGLLDPVSGRRS